MPCPSCLRDTCLLEEHKASLIGELNTLHSTLKDSKKRNHLYRSFIASEYEVLGAPNRVKIPNCIVSFIRSICPISDGRYTGFRAVGEVGDDRHNRNNRNIVHGNGDDDGNGNANENGAVDVTNDSEDEAMETSFEEVEKPATAPPYIDFAGGERVRLGMHYNYPDFSMDHVRRFTLSSPVSGWDIQCHSNFNTT